MILVFGGNGQLGQELVRAAKSGGLALAALSHAEVEIADNLAVSEALTRLRPALVVNAAAYTKVDLAETEVAAARQGNEIGPAVLAAACAESGIPLLHISTDYVFDGRKQSAYVESDPVCPVSVYGRSKAAGEAAIRRSLTQHLILRTAWVYGEFGHNFLKTILRLAASHDELRIVADQRGSPTSTRDLADAILRIAPRLIAGENVWGTYHFTGTGITTWHGFACQIVSAHSQLTGRYPRINAITTADYPTAAQRPVNSELDCSYFEKVFGFRAHNWQEQADAITRVLIAIEQRKQPHVA